MKTTGKFLVSMFAAGIIWGVGWYVASVNFGDPHNWPRDLILMVTGMISGMLPWP